MVIIGTKSEPAFIRKHIRTQLYYPKSSSMTAVMSQTAMICSQRNVFNGHLTRAVLEVTDIVINRCTMLCQLALSSRKMLQLQNVAAQAYEQHSGLSFRTTRWYTDFQDGNFLLTLLLIVMHNGYIPPKSFCCFAKRISTFSYMTHSNSRSV